ncbi:unnamed protein product, partial [Iphiclides podalirius]
MIRRRDVESLKQIKGQTDGAIVNVRRLIDSQAPIIGWNSIRPSNSTILRKLRTLHLYGNRALPAMRQPRVPALSINGVYTIRDRHVYLLAARLSQKARYLGAASIRAPAAALSAPRTPPPGAFYFALCKRPATAAGVKSIRPAGYCLPRAGRKVSRGRRRFAASGALFSRSVDVVAARYGAKACVEWRACCAAIPSAPSCESKIKLRALPSRSAPPTTPCFDD